MARQRRAGALSRALKLIASALFLAVLAFLTFVSEVAVPAARYMFELLRPTTANATPGRVENPPPDEAKMAHVKDQSKWIDSMLEITGALVAAMSADANFLENIRRLESARVQHLHFLRQHRFIEDLTEFQSKIEAFRKTRRRNDHLAMKAAGEAFTAKLGAFRAALWTDFHRKPQPTSPKS